MAGNHGAMMKTTYAQAIPQVTLLNDKLEAVTVDPSVKLSDKWRWAESSIRKYLDEVHAMQLKPRLIKNFIGDKGEIIIAQGANPNKFYEYASWDYREDKTGVTTLGFACRYRAKDERDPHSTVVLMAGPYVDYDKQPFPKPGDKYFAGGNVLVHELGHSGDFKDSIVHSGRHIPSGRHSESELFRLCAKVDRLANPTSSFDDFVRKGLAPSYDTEAKKMHEAIAIAAENYYANNQRRLPQLYDDYMSYIFTTDMRLKADGDKRVRTFLDFEFTRPNLKAIFGDELTPIVKSWLQGMDPDASRQAEAQLLPHKDAIVKKLSDYMINAPKKAQDEANLIDTMFKRSR